MEEQTEEINNNMRQQFIAVVDSWERASNRYRDHEDAIWKYLSMPKYKRILFGYSYWKNYFYNMYKI